MTYQVFHLAGLMALLLTDVALIAQLVAPVAEAQAASCVDEHRKRMALGPRPSLGEDAHC